MTSITAPKKSSCKNLGLSSKFGWAYETKASRTDEKNYELIVSKYMFYINSTGGFIYLCLSSIVKFSTSSINTSLLPKVIKSTHLENEVEQYLRSKGKASIENRLLDIFEKYYNLNRCEEDSSLTQYFVLKAIKISQLEFESETSKLSYFFNNLDSNYNTCIIARSSVYLASTFLIQAQTNDETEKLLNFFKTHNESSKSVKRMQSFTNCINSHAQSVNSSNRNERNKKKLQETKTLNEKLKTHLENRFCNQDGWEQSKIKLIPIYDTNDSETTQSKSNNTKSDLDKKSIIGKEEWGELSNKSHYSGCVMNSCPNGIGKEYREDNQIYKGSFVNGKWHGVGILTNEDLDSTIAEYINGRACGI